MLYVSRIAPSTNFNTTNTISFVICEIAKINTYFSVAFLINKRSTKSIYISITPEAFRNSIALVTLFKINAFPTWFTSLVYLTFKPALKFGHLFIFYGTRQGILTVLKKVEWFCGLVKLDQLLRESKIDKTIHCCFH